MGILSENLEPNLGMLINYYTYTRGTQAHLAKQREDVLPGRFGIRLVKNNHRGMIRQCSELLSSTFEELQAEDMLPNHIFTKLKEAGISCDAIVMGFHKIRGVFKGTVDITLYAKKSGRERFVSMGCITIIVVTDPNKLMGSQRDFWTIMEKQWKLNEPARFTSIFRRKKMLNQRTYLSNLNIEYYVAAR